MEQKRRNEQVYFCKCGSTSADSRILELNPYVRQIRFDLENATQERMATSLTVDRGVIEIPVIVHVVYNTIEQNISNLQIDSQIQVLNQDFRANNPDKSEVPDVWKPLITDAQIEFRLSQITRTNTSKTSFVTPGDAVKFTSKGGQDSITPDTHLNIWVCKLDDNWGYAYEPGVPPEIDGIVINYRAFGTNGTARYPVHLGRTATHEIGHYLNLLHIWGNDTPTCGDSDLVDDTPNQLKPNRGKPKYPSISCNNGPHGDMFMNYMDIVDDDSMFMFTAQQVLRMRIALSQARPNLGVIIDAG